MKNCVHLKNKHFRDNGPKNKRKKLNASDEEIEEQYEKVALSDIDQPRRALLPIKTKSGVIPQSVKQTEKGKKHIK